MNEQSIYITDEDASRLRHLLETRGDVVEEDQQHLQDLAGKLRRGDVMPGSEIPAYVITMRSQVCLKDLDTGTAGEYTLTYPGGADIGQGKVSVLAPVGTALLGRQELDVLVCRVPAGTRRFRIEQVLYQPEAVATASAAARNTPGATPHRRLSRAPSKPIPLAVSAKR